MTKNNNILLINFQGVEKEEILEGMGFSIDKNGYLLKEDKRVLTHDRSSYVRIADVKAVLPGSLDVITDLIEAEEYFKSY
ncbi:MAG: hypothetical protein LVQ96_04050 [Thermoplasmatales archaeon]|nr:hypothetical protein [Thermoplasmatales archaeon]MCW6170326.1 hypothetical protein [Thermoplasmatales archaeon]